MTHSGERCSWHCLYYCTTSSPFLSTSIRGGEAVALADVNAMEVVCSESGVAFGTLPLACVVACLNTLEAEDVEALCQYSILHPRVAARTC